MASEARKFVGVRKWGGIVAFAAALEEHGPEAFKQLAPGVVIGPTQRHNIPVPQTPSKRRGKNRTRSGRKWR